MMVGGAAALWVPDFFDGHRWVRLLTSLGLPPILSAILVGLFTVGLGGYLAVLLWRDATKSQAVLEVSPEGLTLRTEKPPLTVPWGEVREATVVWDPETKVDSSLHVAVASRDEAFQVPDTAVGANLRDVAALIEAYRRAHSHQAG